MTSEVLRSPSLENRIVRVLFVVGLVIGLWMVYRGRCEGDQFKFYVLAWEWVANGEILPYGTAISGGGLLPGPLTTLLSGAPLFVWSDFRSSALLVLAMHVVGYLLLDRVVREALGPRARLLFCLVYWINPWRLYHSAFLWNPNWVFLFCAVHTWSAWRMRDRKSFWMTLWNGLSIGLLLQLQGSFFVLAVMSLFLWLRGYIKVHWGGFWTAVAISVLALVPWILEVLEQPVILPTRDSHLFWALIHGRFVRGILYFFRLPSLQFGREMLDVDFDETLGAGADAVLTPLLVGSDWILGAVTIVFNVLATVVLWRRVGKHWHRSLPPGSDARTWIEGFARWGSLAALFTFVISPNIIMSYHLFTVMQVAVLPPILWFLDLWRRHTSPWLGRALVIFTVFCLLSSVLMALGSPRYVRSGFPLVLRSYHPAVDDFGIRDRCEVRIDPVRGQPIDLLEFAVTERERRAGQTPAEPSADDGSPR